MRAIAAIGIRVAECAHIGHHAIASEPPRLDPRMIEHHGGTAGIVRAIGRELRIELADRNDTSHERVVDRAVLLHEHVNGTVDRIPQLAEIEFAANLSGSRAGVNSHIGAAPSSQQYRGAHLNLVFWRAGGAAGLHIAEGFDDQALLHIFIAPELVHVTAGVCDCASGQNRMRRERICRQHLRRVSGKVRPFVWAPELIVRVLRHREVPRSRPRSRPGLRPRSRARVGIARLPLDIPLAHKVPWDWPWW